MITIPNPLFEGFLANLAVTAAGSLLRRFVVNLESQNIGILAVMLPDLLRDPARELTVTLIGVAIMSPAAKPAADSPVIHI